MTTTALSHTLAIPTHLRNSSYDKSYNIRHANGVWRIEMGRTYTSGKTAREAIAYVRADLARRRVAAGKHAAANAWNGLAMQQSAAARIARTAADLLRDPSSRSLVVAAVADGKSYTAPLDLLATRSEIKTAITLIAERAARRVAREAAAVAAKPGRILDMQADRQAATAQARWHKHATKIRSAVVAAYDECDFRAATAGDHTLTIRIAPEASASSITKKGDQYSKRCTYRKTDSIHMIRIKQDWKRAVERNGFATIDDCLVIDATRTKTGVWNVIYVRQGRGFELVTETGVIVRHGGITRLAKTEAAARAACVKKFAAVIA